MEDTREPEHGVPIKEKEGPPKNWGHSVQFHPQSHVASGVPPATWALLFADPPFTMPSALPAPHTPGNSLAPGVGSPFV